MAEEKYGMSEMVRDMTTLLELDITINGKPETLGSVMVGMALLSMGVHSMRKIAKPLTRWEKIKRWLWNLWIRIRWYPFRLKMRIEQKMRGLK